MSDELMVRQCAPTLAGIKTGSLFSCLYDSRESLLVEIKDLNRRLVPKGLYLLPMRFGRRATLYLYRPDRLSHDLTDKLAGEILADAGYQGKSAGQCVAELARRLRTQERFPHEVGLFLSYPPEDVKGFIDNQAGNFKCVGLWKVYGDEARARALFRRYDRCTADYCRCLSAGRRLDDLAVAM